MARKNMVAIRRQEISDALYRCIVKRGYTNTSVRDIAREANMRSGLIHHYFSSKDEILFALMHDIFSKYRENWCDLVEQNRDKPPRERLFLGIKWIFMKVGRDRDFIKAFYELWNLSHHDENLRRLLKALFKQYRREVAKFISECLKESGCRAEKAQDLAAFLVSACEGAAVQWFIDPRAVSLSRHAQIANQFLEDVIRRSGVKS